MPIHVDIRSGPLFGGQSAHVWDLSEDELESRFLDPRRRGQEVWVQGEGFDWDSAKLQIFDGPPTNEIEDFSPILGPAAFAMTGQLQDVTDRYVTGPPGAQKGASLELETGSAVFVVHGTNEHRREQVARFTGQVVGDEMPVIVLREQPNQGQTLLEKFESSAAEARFAIVLLTADDEGKAVGAAEFELRARQNVVFELGFFFGKLGRERVAVLYEEGVRRPSDIEGLVYIPLDDVDGWKLQLARELRSAGLDVDMNRLT
jgi:predicted nucleotide-binding protein